MASPQTKVRYQFEAFCKKVINGERCDYLRELMRRSSWESSFSDLPPAILDRLYSENDDPAEYYIFRICGHDRKDIKKISVNVLNGRISYNIDMKMRMDHLLSLTIFTWRLVL